VKRTSFMKATIIIITREQRKVRANGTMNKSRHLISLLTIMLQGIIDGCLPQMEEIMTLNSFLNTPPTVHGTSAVSISQLTDWIARMCFGIQGKSSDFSDTEDEAV
jgi:hypothetical protein